VAPLASKSMVVDVRFTLGKSTPLVVELISNIEEAFGVVVPTPI
jgi:hypothetical protein